MPDSAASAVEIVNQLRRQSRQAGMELTPESAWRLLDRQLAEGNLPTGIEDSDLALGDGDLESAIAESFGLSSFAAPVASGLAVIVDVAAQMIQVTATLTLALALSGALCLALLTSARTFSHSARSARRAAQLPASIQSDSQPGERDASTD